MAHRVVEYDGYAMLTDRGRRRYVPGRGQLRAGIETRCKVLEDALPGWLDLVGAAGETSVRQPDGPPVLAIRHSVPEQVRRH